MEFDITQGEISAEGILASMDETIQSSNGQHDPDREAKASLLRELDETEVDPNVEIEDEPMIISLGNACIATIGNISCIIGKAKSKKTYFVSMLMAALLKGGYGKIQAYKVPSKSRILWFDTEQGKKRTQRALRRALKIAEGNSFYSIKSHDLRVKSKDKRLSLIDAAVTIGNPANDIALIVIDGIKDLVSDINDPEEATKVLDWMMDVSATRGIHICTVLHENKGNNQARGHLGTEMINKSETVIAVQKETDLISAVKPEYCRDPEFKSFAFAIDPATGIPSILDDFEVNDNQGPGKKSSRQIVYGIQESSHREIMAKIFGMQREYGYQELLIQAQLNYQEAGFEMGESNIKKAVAKCINLEIIKKDGKPGSKAKYFLNL